VQIVGGVILADFRGDPEIGAKKGRPYLGNQLFLGVAFIPEPLAAKIPVKTALGFRPVDELVRFDGGVALRILEGLGVRQLDEVRAWRIVGLIAAMPEHSAGVGEKPFRFLDQLKRLAFGLRSNLILFRQAFDLLGIEHAIAFHEGDFPLDVLALVVGLGLGEAVGVDDQGAVLALADVAA